MADPTTFGEDLAGASQRALDLAPLLCGACMNYHMLFPIKRHLSTVSDIPDRHHLVEAIGKLLAEATDRKSQIDVVVAGAADSGLLAVCAHAVNLFMGAAMDRARFTVVDRCPTPLALCDDYAAINGLSLTVHMDDLVSTTERYPADIILLHSLLAFIPRRDHVPLFRKLASWLKPQGQIIFSTEVRSPDNREAYRARRSQRAEQVRAAVMSGQFVVKEAVDVFCARLENIGTERSNHAFEFETVAEVQDFIVRTGLKLVSDERIFDNSRLSNGRHIQRERVIAVLAAPE